MKISCSGSHDFPIWKSADVQRIIARFGPIFMMILIVAVAFLALPGQPAAQSQENDSYPAPRFPEFLVNPSEEQMMEAARIAVRQTEGYAPLGNAEPGQTIHVFLHYSQDMEVFEVIKDAWAERGVTAVPVYGWEAVGMTKEAYEKRAQENIITGGEGWKEFGVFEPAYLEFLPPQIQEEIGEPLTVLHRYKEQKAFLDAHPEVEHVFVGSGGGQGFWSAYVGQEHGEKFLGNWIYLNKADLLSKDGFYPSDVWKMVDEHIVRPIPHVAEGTFHDPEGTRLHWTLTPQQSAIWERKSGLTAYSSGHLNIYPPAQYATFKEGIIRAGGNHTAFMPVMTVHLSEHGRVEEVVGGGRAGDLFRIFLNHPLFKYAEFPSAPEQGYWYLVQDGLGTNPKAVRNMQKLTDGTVEMANLIERRRAGVQHFSFSSPVGIGSSGRADIAAQDRAYAEERGIPMEHTGHMHVYFGTVKWQLRDTGEWITIVDKGWVTAFENPEIRALAAKYGDPDTIFSYDWIPEIPGINYNGEYEADYAADPWSWISSVWAKIKEGTYEYYVSDYDMFAQ